MSGIWTTKPPVGSQINLGHTLSKNLAACWLFNEGSGKVHNLIYPFNYGYYANSGFEPYWRKRLVIVVDGGQYPGFVNNIKSCYSGNFTVVMSVYRDNDFTYQSGYTVYWQTNNTNALSCWNNSTAGSPYAYDNVNYALATTSIVGTKLYHVACTFSSAKNYNAIYVNGKFEGSSAHNGNEQITAINIGNQKTLSGRGADATYQYVYVFDKALSPSEIQQLYGEPYAFIQRPSRRLYSIATGGLTWSTSEVMNVV